MLQNTYYFNNFILDTFRKQCFIYAQQFLLGLDIWDPESSTIMQKP